MGNTAFALHPAALHTPATHFGLVAVRCYTGQAAGMSRTRGSKIVVPVVVRTTLSVSVTL